MAVLAEGRSTAMIVVESMTVHIGEGIQLKSPAAFPVWLDLEHWPYIPDTDEEPGEPAFIELLSARLLSPMYLSEGKGFTMSIDPRAELLQLWNDEQYDKVCESLLSGKEYHGNAFDNTKRITL